MRVASNASHWGGHNRVVAGAGLCGVRVGRLLDDSARDDAGKGQRRGGTLTPAGAATRVRVGHARDELLHAEVEELAGGDGHCTLEALGRCVRPATATRCLILGRGHHALLAPVHCLGKAVTRGRGGGQRGLGGGRGSAPRGARVAAVRALLLRGAVAEGVEPQRVRGAARVVRLDARELGRKERQAQRALLGVGVDLAVLCHVARKAGLCVVQLSNSLRLRERHPRGARRHEGARHGGRGTR
mmetsp:Transcript_19260/g.59887  ORF Transcript_19260/g.59887 Transcript_19260/m.59887 type:complete len:243 (-) Transcript_19260:35-763(-)